MCVVSLSKFGQISNTDGSVGGSACVVIFFQTHYFYIPHTIMHAVIGKFVIVLIIIND